MALWRALRPQQWIKNVLIFVALILSHNASNSRMILKALLAFLIFSLCASAVYLLNDIVDRALDRQHPEKKHRPIAAGKFSIPGALTMMAIVLLISFSLALATGNRGLVELLTLYFALTLAYSYYLKRIVILDVMTLAGLYTLRIFFGAVAIGTPISEWLLAFSVFFFLSLALIKRFSSLSRMEVNNTGMLAGRAYGRSDMPMIATLGASSASVSTLVMALYINAPEVYTLYPRPRILWLVCVLQLYWICRLWLLAHRGQLTEDPIVFASQDRISYLIGILTLLIIWLASRGDQFWNQFAVK
jgi:4-hydroxybenzoate polyprenyltransferase